MKVFRYHEDLPAISRDNSLQAIWAASWEKHGWSPIIRGRSDIAYEHLDLLRQMELSNELQRGPTPTGYTLACCVRWLAFLNTGGMIVDGDVLNNGFTPDVLFANIVGDMPLFLSANNCPCAVYATPTGVREMVDTILQHAREVDSGEYDPTSHPSELNFIAHDQAIFGRYNFFWHYPKSPLVCNYSPDNQEWRNYPLIHFPNDTTPKPRGAFIQDNNLIP